MPVACASAQLRKPSPAEPRLSDHVPWANRSSVIWLSSDLAAERPEPAAPAMGFAVRELLEMGVSGESAGWPDRPTSVALCAVSLLTDPVSSTFEAVSRAD